MILLKDLYKSLALTILSNSSVVVESKTDVDNADKEHILEFINEGLTRIHSRFVLRSNRLYIEMQEGRTDYPLRKKFSFMAYDQDNDTNLDYPFIRDTPAHPFYEDVIKILNVYDNVGHRRILNDKNDTHGLFTPRPDTLQCIRPLHGEILSIVYQAKHPLLTGALDQEVDLPETLIPALKYWVGYSFYTGVNGAEPTAKAAEYLQMYESICKEVEDYDLTNGSISTTNVLFKERGWV